MLKLVKILSSGAGVPELERVKKSSLNYSVYEGVALQKTNDGWKSATSYPYCVVAVTPGANDEYVYYYSVTPDMIFLTEYYHPDDVPPRVGSYVSLYTMNVYPECVTLDEDGHGRIIETVPNSNYVYVKFDRRREYESW